MKIDDMRVGDFLYLLDCMQEECCCYKSCNGCRYNEICECDISNIETIAMKETVKSYAESNGLLDHMHYINDQKWIPVSERLPEKYEFVLVCLPNRVMTVASWLKNTIWYSMQGNEIMTPIAWMSLPKPYRGKEV